MKYKTHNDAPIDINGTHLQGHIQANYADLVHLFGEQSVEFDNYKSDAEWAIQFDDGSVATIYNWKNGKNYCGEDGLELEEIQDWNIGGRTPDVVQRIYAIYEGV